MNFKKNLTKYTFFAITGVVLVGCTPSADPHINMKPPAYVEQLPSKQRHADIPNPGSLYGRGQNPIFADRKAMNVNDLVTILISENASQTSSGSHNTSKDSTTTLGAGVFGAAAAPLSTVAKQLNKYGNINFSAGNSNEFSGSGSSSRTEKFTTTLTARIIKVLENGNYFIEGNKELLINGEKQIMQITGVIRPYDISQNNQIDSKFIADAKISYKTEGDIDRATRKPWGTKLMEAIWPF